MVAILIILSLIIPTFVVPVILWELHKVGNLDVKGAKISSEKLKGLPLIDIEEVTSTLELIQRINMVVEEINVAFGTDFPKINTNQGVKHEIQEFIPLVEAYNDLVQSAKEFDKNDPEIC